MNFASIFGCTGATLGTQLKGYGFDEAKVTEVMHNLGLDNAVNAKIIAETAKGKKPDPLAIKYTVVGTKIRELFFKTYPGLWERTVREQKFGKKHGYVRAWTGPVRHLPEFRYMKQNAEGNVVGADSVLYSAEFRHLENDATNSPIQTAEVYQAMPDVTAQLDFVTKFGLRTRVFNTVHDSFELYVYKPERELYYAFLTALAEYSRQPHFGIPMHIDVEESDPDTGMIFREGAEINIEKYDLKTEIENWNEKFPTHKLDYDEVYQVIVNNIPLHGVLDEIEKVGVGYKPHATSTGEDFELVAS